MRISRTLTAIAALTFCLSTQAQQQAAAPASESIIVQLTSVDFAVTDGSGKHVRGLTKEDFEVLENGKPQAVTHFAENEPTGDAPTASAPGRRLLFFFDQASLNPTNRNQVIDAAIEFADKKARPDDRFMVVSFRRGMSLKLNWTPDREALKRVLGEVKAEGAQGATRQQERRRFEREVQLTIEQDAANADKGGSGDFGSLVGGARAYATNVSNDATLLIDNLSALFESLAPIPGNKYLVFSGESLPTRPGMDVFQQLETYRGVIQGSSSASAGFRASAKRVSPMSEAGHYDLSSKVDKLAKSASAARIRVYAVDPGEAGKSDSGNVEATGPTSTMTDFANAGTLIDGIQILAKETGGLALPRARAMAAFEIIDADLSSGYSIGYKTPGASSEPRRIEIRSKKSGLRVRAPSTMLARSIDKDMPTLVTLNVTDPQRNDLGIGLQGTTAATESGGKAVSLVVSIPVGSLTLEPDGAGKVKGGFSVYICTGNDKGDASDVNRQSHALEWPADALVSMQGKALGFAVNVVPAPGTTRISVGVLDHRAGTAAFERMDIP